jgi:hypothetical protein
MALRTFKSTTLHKNNSVSINILRTLEQPMLTANPVNIHVKTKHKKAKQNKTKKTPAESTIVVL